MRRGLPVGTLTACGLVVTGAFLPWEPEKWAFGTVTSLLGVDLPDWLVLAAALFIASLSMMACDPGTRVPPWLRPAFCLYGIAHLALSARETGIGTGNVGIGYMLSSLAFTTLAILVARDTRWRHRKPAQALDGAAGAQARNGAADAPGLNPLTPSGNS